MLPFFKIEENNIMIEKDYTAKDYIIGGIFLIWFIGSIVALFMTAKSAPWLAVSVFGQYFLVFGLIVLVSGIKNGDFKPIFLTFLLVGLLAVSFGVVMHFGSESAKETMQQYIPYAGISIFLFTGIFCIISHFVRKGREEKCTVPVQATCIDIKRRRRDTYEGHNRHSHYHYCPVFGFKYNNKSYEVCTNFFSTGVTAELGKQYDLYINPEHPKCFKEEGESTRQSATELVLGTFFIIVSIIAYVILFTVG